MLERWPGSVETDDPFLNSRDPAGSAASDLIREFLLRADPPAEVYRQDGFHDGYALTVPRLRGVRMVTVPGAHEADFMLHGNPATTAAALAAFIAAVIDRSQGDHLWIPLLTPRQAVHLKERLTPLLPDWRLEASLETIAPFTQRKAHEPSILRKAVRRAEREGFVVGFSTTFPEEQIKQLHNRQWGPNRRDSFYGMLRELLSGGLAELALARTPDGELMAAQVDIVGTHTRHFYYVASDAEHGSGCGTAVLGLNWRRFMESPSQAIYSLGRGSIRYKYKFAEHFRELFALKGFYAPATPSEGSGQR